MVAVYDEETGEHIYNEPPYTDEEIARMERSWSSAVNGGGMTFTRPVASPPRSAVTEGPDKEDSG